MNQDPVSKFLSGMSRKDRAAFHERIRRDLAPLMAAYDRALARIDERLAAYRRGEKPVIRTSTRIVWPGCCGRAQEGAGARAAAFSRGGIGA